MKGKTISFLAAMVFFLGTAACSGPFMVKDPISGTTYYTKKIEKKRDGAVLFKDGRTGSQVTLQNSEIKEISNKAYKEVTQKSE